MATFSAAFGVVKKKATNRFHVPVNLDVRRMMKDPAWNEWFKLNLRCSQRTFELLCKLLEPHFPPVAYLRYNFETGVACTLFHLGSSDGYRETAAAMGVSKAWCVKAVNKMIRVLCCKCPEYVKVPRSAEEWELIEEGFRIVNGFPWCAGAVDGTLVEIMRHHNSDGWYNYKGQASFNIQAVCDHRKNFLSFDIRPGSWSDSKIWKYSKFDDGKLNDECRLYNFIHSSTKMKIEGAFGLLKERFRVFKKALPEKTISSAVRTVLACMVLPNIMIDFENDGISEFVLRESDGVEGIKQFNESGPTVGDMMASRIGKQKRKEFTKMFMTLAGRN
ncbi:hypothetical protein PC128_g22794 [Phytophthora cactorum]|nr:hypothetical protein PC128_g22794 [Phytophthora cactorum]